MSKKDERYAIAVCLLIVLAMGLVGWIENSTPTPQPSVEQMVRSCDMELASYRVAK